MKKEKITIEYKKSSFLRKVLCVVGCFFLIAILAAVFTSCDDFDNASAKSCNLKFKVTTVENVDPDTELDVKLTGTDNDNNNVNETYSAKLNIIYDIAVKSGKYKLNVNVSSLNTDMNIFKSSTKELTISEDVSDVVELTFELDKEAMEKKQAELNAQQQAQNKQQTQSGTGGEVLQEYVIVTTTGKFHLATCRTLSKAKPGNKQVVQSTYSQLVAQGYVPCKVCIG